jgi:hypothetical protein
MSHIWRDRLVIDRAMPSECEIVAAANVPGVGLEPQAAELIAADLAAEREVSLDPVAGPQALTQSEERATLVQEPGERLARFLERRAAMRRGWSASRSVP